jgi:hypothetical protein
MISFLININQWLKRSNVNNIHSWKLNNVMVCNWCIEANGPKEQYIYRGCSGSQKVGARKIASCHFQVPVLKVGSQFRSQLKFLQGANIFGPKQWMIACTTTSFMFSFMYKRSGFVCTNVNVCIVLLFFISISSSKTKRFI